VPASLERKGSVRTFWSEPPVPAVPLYLLAGASGRFYLTHIASARGEAAHPEASFLSQLLMMIETWCPPEPPNVVWSCPTR